MNALIVRDLRPVAEACNHMAEVIIKGSDIKITKAEFQHWPTPLLMLTPSAPVVGPEQLDPQSPLLAPRLHTLPVLLHGLAVGRPAAEAELLSLIADRVQATSASTLLLQLDQVSP